MSADGTLLLEVHTATRRYLVPRGHLDQLAQVAPGAPALLDARGRPLALRELGPLLDPADRGPPGRRHALVVSLRRRAVALLVERAEALDAPGAVQPLGPLLHGRLARPWALGAVLVGAAPVVVLDLRRIAADVALGAV
ncbi:MAG TPA: hypothetical protein PKD53_19115 [Chloroflexaceae bacterium]|nr:hypothetical protein [Chloroflexaceae bacterium]